MCMHAFLQKRRSSLGRKVSDGWAARPLELTRRDDNGDIGGIARVLADVIEFSACSDLEGEL